MHKTTKFSDKILKLYGTKKNESFLIKEIKSIKFVKLKSVRISDIDDRSKTNKNINLRNIYINNDKKFNDNIRKEKYDKVFKNSEFSREKIKTIRKIHSAKILKNYKDFKKKISDDKVNLIIKDLLSKDYQNYNMNDIYSKNKFLLNKTIDQKKYIDYNLQNDPDNTKLCKNYSGQIKYYLNKNAQNSLIKGIYDYHKNRKKYKEIYFDFFSRNNNEKRKLYPNKNKNNVNKGINKKFLNSSNSGYKTNDLLYNSMKEKFKDECIKFYNEKCLNRTNDLYLKYINNNAIKKFMSLEDKINLACESSKNLLNYLKKDKLKSIKNKNRINEIYN